MKWNLEVGPHIKDLEQVEKQTGKTPAMLTTQPELHQLLYWVWEAYIRLDRSRQFGFNGPQPISLSEIEAYCRLNHIEDRSDLTQYIQVMDGAYIDHAREKTKRESKKRGRTPSRHKG